MRPSLVGAFFVAFSRHELKELFGGGGEHVIFSPNQHVTGFLCRPEGNKTDVGRLQDRGDSLDGNRIIVAGPNEFKDVARQVMGDLDVQLVLVQLEDVADFITDNIAVGQDQGELASGSSLRIMTPHCSFCGSTR